MKVFISWSGEASGNLAEVLRQWIPGVIQAVKPYYSSGDVAKGARWTSEIAKELEESRIGLICLTRENLEAPWLIFEAGALSKSLDKSRVCPILFDLEPTDLKGPLAQFQASKFQKNEIKRVMKTINAELGENALPDDVLDSVFDMWWPRLEERVQEELEKQGVSESKRVRSERDLLEEILQLSRLQSNSSQQAYSFHPKIIDKLLEAHETMIRDTKEGNLPSTSLEALEGVMNFNLGAVTSGYAEQKTIPKRRFRRRVGVRSPVPGAPPGRRTSTRPQPARGVQWFKVGSPHRLTVTLHSPRPAALGGRLPADAAMDQGGSV